MSISHTEPHVDMAAKSIDVDRFNIDERKWLNRQVRVIRAEGIRSADTHLIKVPLAEDWGIDFYLKDESSHPTGSLKHRLARSLFLHALCNGWIRPGRPVIEASSGSTAVSEAYFARLIGVPFIAVMAASTSAQKIELIEFYGGKCHLVEKAGEVYQAATELAAETGGHYMDQFTYAERATDWRGNNNIAESIIDQLSGERYPEPEWIVATAGTGGTSATLSRYVRYQGFNTGVCVGDPDNSAFFPGWETKDDSVVTGTSSMIEGIGRQRVEPSFIGSCVDRMIQVPDGASIAGMRVVSELLGKPVGASTGTGVWASLEVIAGMIEQGRTGSVVSLICDPGERYLDKYYSSDWLHNNGIYPESYDATIARFFETGKLSLDA